MNLNMSYIMIPGAINWNYYDDTTNLINIISIELSYHRSIITMSEASATAKSECSAAQGSLLISLYIFTLLCLYIHR